MTCPWTRTTTREPRLPRALPHAGLRGVGLVASTALLTTATILLLSAPQDAIAWAMTFDFGHGGGDAHDRLADRPAFAAKPVMALGNSERLDCRLPLRDGASQGATGARVVSLLQTTLPGGQPCARLPGRGGLHLTLGLPHAGAGRHLGLLAPALVAARRRGSEAPLSSTETGRGHGRAAAGACRRRLTAIGSTRDPARVPGGRHRTLRAHQVLIVRRQHQPARPIGMSAELLVQVHSGVDGNVRSQRDHAHRHPEQPGTGLLGRSPSTRWRRAISAPASSYSLYSIAEYHFRSQKSYGHQAPTTLAWWRRFPLQLSLIHI